MSRCCEHVSRHFRRVSAAGMSWANRLHAAGIGSYSGWPPLRCVRTASPTSRIHYSYTRRTSSPPADCNGRRSSEIPKCYPGARDTTFPRSARNNWIPKHDGYIHTYIHNYISEIRCRISCLVLKGARQYNNNNPRRYLANGSLASETETKRNGYS